MANNIVNSQKQAEDIVQDVFFNLWRNIDKVNLDNSLKGYLYQSTINASVNYLKRNKNQHHIDIDEAYLENIFFVDEDQNPIETSELIDAVKESIHHLPPKCKAIFLMSRQEGLKYKQIAEELGVSVKTVENQIGIALKKLRKDLGPYTDSLPAVLIASLKAFLEL